MVTLLGQCFEIAVNEKQLKGGSSNMIVREYVFKLCPFHNITQHEPNYHAWVRAQERAKFRDPTTVDDDELAKLVGRSDSQAPIMIGLYNAFQNGHTLRYENGQKCGTIPRQAIVHLECGRTNRILQVEENEMCVYTLKFQTPAMCFASRERDEL